MNDDEAMNDVGTKRKHASIAGDNDHDHNMDDGSSSEKQQGLDPKHSNSTQSTSHDSSQLDVVGAVLARELSSQLCIGRPCKRPVSSSKHHATSGKSGVVSLLLLHGSWNKLKSPSSIDSKHSFLSKKLQACLSKTNMECQLFYMSQLLQILSVQVDEDEDSLDICIADTETLSNTPSQLSYNHLRIKAPAELPALMLVYSQTSQNQINGSPYFQLDIKIKPMSLLACIHSSSQIYGRHEDEIQTSFVQELVDLHQRLRKTISTTNPNATVSDHPKKSDIKHAYQDTQALRIFVGGDRSQVGKSSICLGLLGSLIRQFNYSPSDLAYIKPATQCEETQLVSQYCQSLGIEACPVGPVVYYKGFTRAFLNGQTDSSDALLVKIQDAVDKISIGKKVVIIDGVGYPAVGSITGTDNASVARVCGYPENVKTGIRRSLGVIIVGKSGVGDAIDSYNLNSSYFEAKGVPVIGGIFNRLSTQGYYSLDNCKSAISSYFTQYKTSESSSFSQEAFGFLPESKELAHAMDNVETFIELFGQHVNILNILKKAQALRDGPNENDGGMKSKPTKRQKLPQESTNATSRQSVARSRADIENLALKQGAATSA